MVYDLVIIGGGPAGISAGIYAARQKLNTLLVTKDFGGQISRKAVAIENYPGLGEISGQELIQKMEEHLRRFVEPGLGSPLKIEKGLVVDVKKKENNFVISTEDGKNFESLAVIVASGADPRPLEVPGEKEFIGRGVSYCTTCDGPVFKDKIVAVVGGGSAGFEAAISLSSWAEKIYILEFMEEVAAFPILQERAKTTSKIEVFTSAALKEIKGDKFVNSIIYQDRKTEELKTLAVDGVFVEIGSLPATSFVKSLVEFSERDEIIVDPYTAETKTPGLFAAGDVDTAPYKQIIIAAGEGAKAALSVFKYLQGLKYDK